jgi:probable ATP-dependent RNA helicase DDX4
MFAGGISTGMNFDKYDIMQVNVTGENIPKPIENFETSGLRQLLVDNIHKSGYLRPTPVQKHALPIVMAGRDLMACAQTGSGKTAAFLLPMIHSLLHDSKEPIVTADHCEPQAVIISPTRELTLQIFNEARKFAHRSIIKIVVVYGGAAAYHQAQHVMNGCHILVATPGRLLDFVDKGRITFSSLRFLVLDEADRMLDMGFMPGIERMIGHPTMVTTGERQTLMFSATFPEDIQRLAGKFLSNYLFLAVGIVGSACSDVEQHFHLVPKFEKRSKLTELISQEGGTKILVFVEMKRTADFIAAYLSEHDFPTTSIHGDRLQREREEALADFKSGRMVVLVATAVAARGLDIKDVYHVINYDLPKSIDEYVHRIGRTGRVGNCGKATSFYDPEVDAPLARDLLKILQQADQDIPSWLEKDASSAVNSLSHPRPVRFGGKDFRKFELQKDECDSRVLTEGNYNEPQPTEPEEEW